MRKIAGIGVLILLAALYAACGLSPKEKVVNILVEHDRWGEVAPCG